MVREKAELQIQIQTQQQQWQSDQHFISNNGKLSSRSSCKLRCKNTLIACFNIDDRIREMHC